MAKPIVMNLDSNKTVEPKINWSQIMTGIYCSRLIISSVSKYTHCL